MSLLQQLIEEQNGVCALCSFPLEESEANKDHIIPKSKGGPNTRSNFQATHKVCNSKKSSLSMEEWWGLGFTPVLISKTEKEVTRVPRISIYQGPEMHMACFSMMKRYGPRHVECTGCSFIYRCA